MHIRIAWKICAFETMFQIAGLLSSNPDLRSSQFINIWILFLYCLEKVKEIELNANFKYL